MICSQELTQIILPVKKFKQKRLPDGIKNKLWLLPVMEHSIWFYRQQNKLNANVKQLMTLN